MGMFDTVMKRLEDMNAGAQKAKKKVQGESDTTQPDQSKSGYLGQTENAIQKRKRAMKEIEDQINKGSGY